MKGGYPLAAVVWLTITMAVLIGAGCRGRGGAFAGKTAGEMRIVRIGAERVIFHWIPPGRFRMGSPPEETARENDETCRNVEVRDGFWLAETECTQWLWSKVMGGNPSGFRDDPACPVENVSWNDSRDFLSKIKRYCPDPNWRFELPTEVQWEYACRAGSVAPFPEPLENSAWHLYNAASRSHPVGKLRPNAWGLADMHGNIAEWCSDIYSELPGGGAPSGPGLRVIRGGSWDSAWTCRAAARNSDSPSLRIDRVGFRIALVPVKR
jgi:formylglycine-generating enzyme required for sulfatase activity